MMRKAPVIRCAYTWQTKSNMIIPHGAQGPSEIICNNINSTNIEKNKRIHYNNINFTFQFKPSEFAAQINLSMDNCWGIVRCIIDQVMSQKVFLKN